jgi:hypothetical protein
VGKWRKQAQFSPNSDPNPAMWLGQKGKMPSYTLVEGIFDPYYEYNLN